MKLKIGSGDRVVSLYSGDALEDVRYGRWRDDSRGRYLVPALLSGSDYSGSLVERSNFESFADDFSGADWWTDAPGGHGTFAIVIDMDRIPEEAIEFLNGLQDYPLADEDRHSALETEAQDQAWENWAADDFRRGLERKFDVELDDVDPRALSEAFYRLSDESGTYWENQSGGDMWIDLDRIVKAANREDLRELLASFKIRNRRARR
jgi:hypothetical protein